jgi:hypothetical protein
LAYLGDAPAESLKALFLLLFVWLLFESKKTISLEAMDDDGSGPNVPQLADDSLKKMGIESPTEGAL